MKPTVSPPNSGANGETWYIQYNPQTPSTVPVRFVTQISYVDCHYLDLGIGQDHRRDQQEIELSIRHQRFHVHFLGAIESQSIQHRSIVESIQIHCLAVRKMLILVPRGNAKCITGFPLVFLVPDDRTPGPRHDVINGRGRLPPGWRRRSCRNTFGATAQNSAHCIDQLHGSYPICREREHLPSRPSALRYRCVAQSPDELSKRAFISAQGKTSGEVVLSTSSAGYRG